MQRAALLSPHHIPFIVAAVPGLPWPSALSPTQKHSQTPEKRGDLISCASETSLYNFHAGEAFYIVTACSESQGRPLKKREFITKNGYMSSSGLRVARRGGGGGVGVHRGAVRS